MSIAIWFWLVMFLWLVLGAVKSDRTWQGIGGALLPFLAVLLLGWHEFGSPVQ